MFILKERTPAGGIRASQGTFSSLMMLSPQIRPKLPDEIINFGWHPTIVCKIPPGKNATGNQDPRRRTYKVCI